MTTTEPLRIEPAVDDERAARLARLAARHRPPDPARSVREAPTLSWSAPPTSPASRPPRRRSPARDAKILTVGASTTALLGIVAGFGIADARSSDAATPASQTPDPAAVPDPAMVPPASVLETPPAVATTTPPQVIVVLVDAATGRPIGTATDGTVPAAVLDQLPVDATSAPAAPQPQPAPAGAPAPAEPAPTTAPVAPQPQQAPVAVDLAVPAPPPPPPAAAPAPQPQPQPQATSSGS